MAQLLRILKLLKRYSQLIMQLLYCSWTSLSHCVSISCVTIICVCCAMQSSLQVTSDDAFDGRTLSVNPLENETCRYAFQSGRGSLLQSSSVGITQTCVACRCVSSRVLSSVRCRQAEASPKRRGLNSLECLTPGMRDASLITTFPTMAAVLLQF